ncbi:twin-arginine translocation pathway signal, partial [Flavihumibacter sediminis]|nr:twin-arginine translocation pathway signal [Flavihumibacter sediminis]
LYQAGRSPLFQDFLNAHDQEHAEHTVSYLYKTLADTKKSTAYIYEHSQQLTTGLYPNHELGRNLKTIASLILSDINTQVYYVSIGSFDTHVGQ